MYAPPKAAVLVSGVLTFIPVAGRTLRRLLHLVPYPVKLFQYAFALRQLLFFDWLSLDLLFPFRKLPLMLFYYPLSLIVDAMNVCPSG